MAPRRSWSAAAVAVLLPTVAGALALAASWERWINPLVDSGREMDVPWRLAHGERLYGGVTYYYGPLGPWLNALALRVFGSRLAVLLAVNLLLAAVILAVLHQVTRQAGGSRAAAIAATTLAAAFCLGAPNGGAYIFPYSSSSLVALAGALLALWLSGRAERGGGAERRRPDAAACGAPGAIGIAGAPGAFGLPAIAGVLAAVALAAALAARVEVGVAAAAALVAAALRSSARREALGRCLAVVVPGGALALALYAAAVWGLPEQVILHDGPLTHFAGMPAEWQRLYLHTAGLDAPWRTAGQVLASLGLDGALLALAARFALPAPRPRLRYAALMLGLLAAYLASPLADPLKNLPPLVTALPLVVAGAAVALLLRRPLAGARERSRLTLLAFSALAGGRVLLGMSLGPRMGPYVTLPLPGLLASAAVLADGLAPRLPAPAAFRRRLAAVAAVLAGLFLHRLDRADHRPPLGVLHTTQGELLLPREKAQAIGQTLGLLAARGRPGDMLTAFPEGGFFNFVTGLRSPLRQDEVTPGVLSGGRELEAAGLIRRAGPRFVLLLNRPTGEYGPASFGRDYDVLLWREVERDYRLIAVLGAAGAATPVGGGPFFIRIYERVG